MKQNSTLPFERKYIAANTKIEEPKTIFSSQSQHQKATDKFYLMKQLVDSIQANKQKEGVLAELEKQLHQLEMEQKSIDSNILKTQLEYETLKLENLQKKHRWEEEKEQQEEQNDIDMNLWLQEVQKYNGLPQSAIDSLLSMEYEGNPLDSDICLSCYSEMKTGDMSKYLPCAHLFHMKCIDEHLKLSKVCPACMQQVII